MMGHHQEKTWKYFNKNPLTHSAGHYLLTIYDLHQQLGYARMTDVGRHLDVRPSTCCAALVSLKKKEFVTEDKNKFLLLTQKGEHWVKVLIKNEKVLEHFFHNILGVDESQAEIDACKMEHLISEETSIRLCEFLHFIEGHPKEKQAFLSLMQKFHKQTIS